jgi:hypothetical protein
MVAQRAPWINVLALIVGGVVLGVGVGRLILGAMLGGSVLAVLGFLIVGWAVLDRRRFRRGTPESEVDGGRTIE